MFKNISLKIKLIGLCGLLSSLLLVVGGIGWNTLSRVSENYSHIAEVNLKDLRSLSNMRYSINNITLIYSKIINSKTSSREALSLKKEFDETLSDYEKEDKAYTDVKWVAGEKEIYDRTNEKWKRFKFLALKITDLGLSRRHYEMNRAKRLFQGEMVEAQKGLIEGIKSLLDFQDEESKKWTEKAEKVAKIGNILVWFTVIIGFSTAFCIGYFFSRFLSDTLQRIASKMNVGSDEVALAARGIAQAGLVLSSSSNEQAAAIQETVASIDQISAMVSKNTDYTKRSQELSLRSQGAATRGKQVVEEMIQSIHNINNKNNEIMKQIEESNREISEIVKVIAEIGNKTKVINDIVFQTKLLSFNASVEAARAGEHGKGFAVVAEEVGNLAQMSGNASKEISQMLEGSIQKVDQIVSDTKSRVDRLVVSGKESVNEGSQTAQRCGQVLDEIVSSASELNEMINQISNASQEQFQGVQEITRAMSQLDQVTQQNATSAQHSASSSAELTEQAQKLRFMVKDLNILIQGGMSQTSVSASSKKTNPNSKPHVGPRSQSKGENSISNVIPLNNKEFTSGSASKESSAGKTKTSVASNKNHENSKTAPQLRKVVGKNTLPSENDPRFEDV